MQSATRLTNPISFRQFEFGIDDTAGAPFTGRLKSPNLDKVAAIPLALVAQKLFELTPSCIRNTFRQAMIFEHTFHVQRKAHCPFICLYFNPVSFSKSASVTVVILCPNSENKRIFSLEIKDI